RVLSRARLIEGVWDDGVYIEERTVDVHIRRLRLALAATGHDHLIETVRGGGYRFLPR
ncbi:MAG: winged helix-turn-helix domain-containing protein, partial [Gammaproteobacteria bacterium]